MSVEISKEFIEEGIIKALLRVVESHPDKIAVADIKVELSFKEFWVSICNIAKVLQKKGLKERDRIAFSLPNCVDLLCLHFAILRIGAISVPIESKAPIPSIIKIAAICEPALIVIEDNHSDEEILLNYNILNISDLLSEAAITENALLPLLKVHAESSLSSIMFTSGSTGTPRGVKLTHKNNLAAIRNIITYCGYSKDDFEVITLPLSHSFGLGQVYAMLLSGGGVFVIHGMLKIKAIVNALKRYEATGFPTTPAGVDLILNRYFEAFQENGRALRNIVVNSAPLMPSQTEKLQELFPSITIYVYYGLTEASRSCFWNLTEGGPNFYTSVGPPMQGVQVSIESNSSEILISGETVSSGYWPDDDHNLDTSGSPIISTGDIGYFDVFGNLYISGRIKDQINIGGYKVSPLEIENFLKNRFLIPGVAVFGSKTIEGKEQIVCFIENLEGLGIDETLLRAAIKDELAFYKVPSVFIGVEKIPTIINGKIDRSRLHELYQNITQILNEG